MKLEELRKFEVFALFARGAEFTAHHLEFIPLQDVTSVLPQLKMLYLVGLGLSDETDITVKGLEIVRKASRVYLEAYTSILLVDKVVLVCPPAPSPITRADADA